MSVRALGLAAALLLTPAPALAQDFAAAAPSPGGDALSLVESGVPPLAGGVSIESATVRWFGSPELTTRSLAARGAWRASRWGLGLSRTGTVELGWDAAAAAIGVARVGVERSVRLPSPSCPFWLSPQQYCAPSDVTAHVSAPPAVMLEKVCVPATFVGALRFCVVPSPS